jgi:hypothetical protein
MLKESKKSIMQQSGRQDEDTLASSAFLDVTDDEEEKEPSKSKS